MRVEMYRLRGEGNATPKSARIEGQLCFLAKVELGLEQSEGETFAHEEIKNRFRKSGNHYVTEDKQ